MNLQNTLIELVKQYVKRQEVVKKAIEEIRPDFFAVEDDDLPLMELIAIAEAHVNVPQRGIWQDGDNIWEYYTHGRGCRLTNQHTGEVIEWDVPDLNKFYDEWFIIWLRWYLEENADSEALKALHDVSKEEIRAMISEAADAGLLERVNSVDYRIK